MGEQVSYYTSKPRRTPFAQICKRLSLNVGERSRPYKMRGRAAWDRLRGISRARSRMIPNLESPCVYDTRHLFLVFGGRRPPKAKYRFKKQIHIRHQLKRTYGGLTDGQLKRIYRRTNAVRFGGEFFLSRLERRVDTVLWRAGFVQSVREGRRWVTNGYAMVNDKVVRSPNALVKVGDFVSISPAAWWFIYIRRRNQVISGAFTNPASWLRVDYNTLVAGYVEKAEPGAMRFSHPVDTAAIESRYSAGRNAGHRRIQ